MWRAMRAEIEKRWRFIILPVLPAAAVVLCVIYHRVELSLRPYSTVSPVALRENAGSAMLLTLALLALVAIAAALHRSGGGQTNRPSCSIYEFCLPVRSASFVFCALAYSFIVSAIAYTVLAVLMTRISTIELPRDGSAALVVAMLTVALHAAGFVSKRSLSVVLFVVVSWTACAFVALTSLFSDAVFCLSVIVYNVVIWAVAAFNYGRIRRGECIPIPSFRDVLPRLVDSAWIWKPKCASPRSALFWFEMKRTGAIVILANAALLMSVALPWRLVTCAYAIDKPFFPHMWSSYACVSAFFLAILVPAVTAEPRYLAYGRGDSPYDMTRPISVRDMASVRIRVVFATFFLAWSVVLLAGISGIVGFLRGLVPILTIAVQQTSPIHCLSVGLLVVSCGAAILWTVLGICLYGFHLFPFDLKNASRWCFLEVCVLGDLIVAAAIQAYEAGFPRFPLEIAGVLGGIGFVVLIARSLVEAVARDYLSRRTLDVVIPVWLVWALFVAGYFWHRRQIAPDPQPLAFLFRNLCLLILPLAPLATIPLAIAELRHQ